MVHEVGVVFAAGMANVHETMKDAAMENMSRLPFLGNVNERVDVPRAGGQYVLLASLLEDAVVVRVGAGPCRKKDYADPATVKTVLTKLGFALCNVHMLMTGRDHRDRTLLEVVPLLRVLSYC